MRYDPEKHHRRSIRLKDYDYGQDGAYAVTICTQNRECHFNNSLIAAIAEQCWLAIPDHANSVELDEWILMPNHLHGILVITREVGRGVQLNAPMPPQNTSHFYSAISPQKESLGVIIRTYKAAVTTLCRNEGYVDFAWQRSFYDRIIRDEPHLNRVRQYIIDNPAKWAADQYNPEYKSGW